MWFGFGISAFLTFQCFQDLVEPYHNGEEEAATEEEKTTSNKAGREQEEPVSNVEENA